MASTAQQRSRVRASVDYRAPGKQFGHLIVPYSRDESAWGSLRIPIIVINGGPGPTVLFTAGNHGDEYEGQIALLKLAHALEPPELAGRVIILPALNFPAVRAGTRVSPIDAGNMNRMFPGSRNGTMTPVIAHYVYTEVLPLADVVVDIHSGGKTLSFVPCAVMHQLENEELMQRTMDALLAFGAPVGLVLLELDNEGMLDTAVEEMGKIFLSTELGGGGTVTTQTVAIADAGVRNVLAHFGLLREGSRQREAEAAAQGGTVRLLHTPDDDCFVSAGEGGLYEPLVDLGSEVEAGAAIGRIHFFERPERPPELLRVARPGMLVCRHYPGLAQAGDCLAVVATDYARG